MNALDVFIILIAIACAVGVGARIYLGDRGDVLGRETSESGEYLVSFLVLDIRESSADCFVSGDVFYSQPSGDLFGTLIDTPTFTPAELFIEDEEGNYILTYSTESGDDARIDVRGTFTVSGTMTDEGFLVGGKTYVAANKMVAVQSEKIFVNMTITDITKAS